MLLLISLQLLCRILLTNMPLKKASIRVDMCACTVSGQVPHVLPRQHTDFCSQRGRVIEHCNLLF